MAGEGRHRRPGAVNRAGVRDCRIAELRDVPGAASPPIPICDRSLARSHRLVVWDWNQQIPIPLHELLLHKRTRMPTYQRGRMPGSILGSSKHNSNDMAAVQAHHSTVRDLAGHGGRERVSIRRTSDRLSTRVPILTSETQRRMRRWPDHHLQESHQEPFVGYGRLWA
jgi:hypothetical protein